jgi:hypothetical protein
MYHGHGDFSPWKSLFLWHDYLDSKEDLLTLRCKPFKRILTQKKIELALLYMLRVSCAEKESQNLMVYSFKTLTYSPIALFHIKGPSHQTSIA